MRNNIYMKVIYFTNSKISIFAAYNHKFYFYGIN